MDIRVLRYFLAVAQEESMTKAAEILHTTQPNLSRQLQELELEVGQKLFIKGNKKTTLTEEGMFLRKRASEIVELTERTQVELISYNKELTGTVHIGAIETYAIHMLAECMINMRKSHSSIQFDMFSGSNIELIEMLNKGLIDFALLVAPIDLNKFDYIKLPFTDVFGVIMKKESPLAKLDTITPKDIKDKPLLVSKQQLDGNVLSSWFGKYFKDLNIVSTFNLIRTPAMMVDAGLGYAFTFDKLINTSKDSSLCFRPLEPKMATELYLVWKKHQMFTKPADIFLNYIKNVLCKE